MNSFNHGIKKVSFEDAEKNRLALEGEYKEKFGVKDVDAYESCFTYREDFSTNLIVLKGPCVFINEGGDDDVYKSDIYEGDVKFLDLFHEFNISIKETNDFHHIFLEDIYIKEEDGVKRVVFITGS